MSAYVLIADDEQSVADDLAATLQPKYTTTVAYSGESAIELIDDTIDVVLLDRRMPGLSGDDVLQRIRRQEYACQVAMVTAVDPGFDIIDMPFDAYITKPVAADDLTSTVHRLVQRSKFDAALGEYVTLVSKRSALEQEYSADELAQTEEFHDLIAEIERLETKVSDLSADLPDEELFDIIDPPPAAVDPDEETTGR
jgi:DNA-binding response OmpR family regulator